MPYQRTLTTKETIMTTGHHTLNWVNHLQLAGYDEMYYQVNPLDAPAFISAGSTHQVPGTPNSHMGSVDTDRVILFVTGK